MINFGKGIAEYEDRETEMAVFEEPYKYNKIFDEDYHIISGRKGAGKSTIVDHQSLMASTSTNGEQVIVLRPQAGDELFETIKGIAQSPKKFREGQRLSISKLFDFIIFVELMTHFIKGRENRLLRQELSVVYEYLTSNDLLEGSAIRKSLFK